ncbi:hypothetical protein AG1IA_08304 [Rhizoctonia solani AG-1 IA]|uniref:Complex 1 LYR protein domain-containing protein n=1 Tax=Thanatephorus cucumeris (strain AG1-IA) TaxID=983506 RepID=L8WLM3_THACA|nr:hypothetical protein AG1IA_08304 [Rhizoctonia solani AG-1 IA]
MCQGSRGLEFCGIPKVSVITSDLFVIYSNYLEQRCGFMFYLMCPTSMASTANHATLGVGRLSDYHILYALYIITAESVAKPNSGVRATTLWINWSLVNSGVVHTTGKYKGAALLLSRMDVESLASDLKGSPRDLASGGFLAIRAGHATSQDTLHYLMQYRKSPLNALRLAGVGIMSEHSPLQTWPRHTQRYIGAPRATPLLCSSPSVSSMRRSWPRLVVWQWYISLIQLVASFCVLGFYAQQISQQYDPVWYPMQGYLGSTRQLEGWLGRQYLGLKLANFKLGKLRSGHGTSLSMCDTQCPRMTIDLKRTNTYLDLKTVLINHRRDPVYLLSANSKDLMIDMGSEASMEGCYTPTIFGHPRNSSNMRKMFEGFSTAPLTVGHAHPTDHFSIIVSGAPLASAKGSRIDSKLQGSDDRHGLRAFYGRLSHPNYIWTPTPIQRPMAILFFRRRSPVETRIYAFTRNSFAVAAIVILIFQLITTLQRAQNEIRARATSETCSGASPEHHLMVLSDRLRFEPIGENTMQDDINITISAILNNPNKPYRPYSMMICNVTLVSSPTIAYGDGTASRVLELFNCPSSLRNPIDGLAYSLSMSPSGAYRVQLQPAGRVPGGRIYETQLPRIWFVNAWEFRELNWSDATQVKELTRVRKYSLPLVLVPGSQITSEASLITRRFITSSIVREILFNSKPVRNTPLCFICQHLLWDRPPWSVWTWRFTKSRILPNLKGLTGIWEYSLPLVLLPGSQITSEANLITGRFITSLIARDILFDFKPYDSTLLAQLSGIPLNDSDARVATADIQITLNPGHMPYRTRLDPENRPFDLREDVCDFIEDYRSGTVLDVIGSVGGLFALLQAAHLLLFRETVILGTSRWAVWSFRHGHCPFGLLGRCSSRNFKRRLREEYHTQSDEESAHTIQIVKFLRDFVIDFGPADLDSVADRPRESRASSVKAESDAGDENEPDSEIPLMPLAGRSHDTPIHSGVAQSPSYDDNDRVQHAHKARAALIMTTFSMLFDCAILIVELITLLTCPSPRVTDGAIKPTTCQLIRLGTGLYGRTDISKALSIWPQEGSVLFPLDLSVRFNILFDQCSDSNSLRCSLLASRSSSRRPRQPTTTKTATATTFGGAAKVVVYPLMCIWRADRYGGIRGVIVPPKHHCGRWYWDTNLGSDACIYTDTVSRLSLTGPTHSARPGGAGTTERTRVSPLLLLCPTLAMAPGELVLDSVGRRTFGGVPSRSAWRLAGRLFFQLFQTDGRVRVTGTGTATGKSGHGLSIEELDCILIVRWCVLASACLVRSGTGRTLYAGLVIDGTREPRVASGDTKPGFTGIYITTPGRKSHDRVITSVCMCMSCSLQPHHSSTDMRRLSGLQKEVLGLYRRALRMVQSKPLGARENFTILVQYEFRVRGAVSARDVGTIEYLIRRGKKRVEMLEDPGVKECWVSGEMRDWYSRRR